MCLAVAESATVSGNRKKAESTNCERIPQTVSGIRKFLAKSA